MTEGGGGSDKDLRAILKPVKVLSNYANLQPRFATADKEHTPLSLFAEGLPLALGLAIKQQRTDRQTEL